MSSTFRSTRSLVTLAVAAVGLGTLAAIPAAQQGQVVTTPSGLQLRVEPVVDELRHHLGHGLGARRRDVGDGARGQRLPSGREQPDPIETTSWDGKAVERRTDDEED